MNKELQYKFNNHINAEIYSAYLYMAMAARAAILGYQGAYNWLNVQFDEEMSHARKMISYLIGRGVEVHFYDVDSAEEDYANLQEIYSAVLAHEKHVTKLIVELGREAEYYEDAAAKEFLQWFIDEQAEEEQSAAAVVNRLADIAEDAAAITAYDAELGQRK